MRPLVIVPTYNERPNLPALVDQLLAIPGLRILIVDDASPDGTGRAADEYAAANRARIQVLHRQGKRGLGLSYIDGMYVALRTDATHVCQMDADLSHNPADIPRLLTATEHADFAIGSRYVRGGRIENWPLHRRLLSAFANRYIRAITRITIRDCTSGFRCWRRKPSNGCRWRRFDPMVTRSSWNSHLRRCARASPARRCQSPSSSGVRARRSCRAW
jgi:dolichol-phosphate mannosyltransferase